MDGSEVITGLRGWTTAPIIVLSGRTDQPQKIAALDAGADDYVTKPFDIEELFARMRAVVRRAIADGAEPAARDRLVDRRPGHPPGPSPRRRRPRPAAHPDRVAHPRAARPPPGSPGHPAAAAHRGLGAGLPEGDQLPPALHGPAAPQARAGPGPPPLPAHRPRDGVPVRASHRTVNAVFEVCSRGGPNPAPRGSGNGNRPVTEDSSLTRPGPSPSPGPVADGAASSCGCASPGVAAGEPRVSPVTGAAAGPGGCCRVRGRSPGAAPLHRRQVFAEPARPDRQRAPRGRPAVVRWPGGREAW